MKLLPFKPIREIAEGADITSKKNAFLGSLDSLKSGKIKEIKIESLGLVDNIKANIKSDLDKIVIGQEEAKKVFLDIIGAKLFSNKSNKKGVLGSALFVGPTGVGKTQLAEALGEVLLGGEGRITLIEGETFQQAHEISKLIGSPPGYVGFETSLPILSDKNIYKHFVEARDKNELNNLVRYKQGFSIVIVDEFEKMHPDTRQVFLNILSNGEVKLATGKEDNKKLDYSKVTNFRNTIFIFTTNAGTNTKSSSIGFNKVESIEKKGTYENEIKQVFSQEFLGRINRNIVVFNQLTTNDLKEIIKLKTAKIQRENLEGYDLVKLEFDKSAVDYLIQKGYKVETGARQLNTTIEAEITSEIDKIIYENFLDIINHPVILKVKMVGETVKLILKNNSSKDSKKSEIKDYIISRTSSDIIKGGEIILPLHNGSLLMTYEKITEFIITYVSLFKLRDLSVYTDKYELELEDLEKKLTALGFSKNDLSLLKEKAIRSLLEDNFAFIYDYFGLTLSTDKEKSVFFPFNWIVIKKIIKRKFKEIVEIDSFYPIEKMIKEFEEILCNMMGKKRLSSIQLIELTKLVHNEFNIVFNKPN